MRRVAEAMTNKLRTLDVNHSVAYGDMYVNQTCVRVVWPWLILPTILILITCCFLIATILRTSSLLQEKHGIPDTWKSNQLAVLLHGLSRETRNALGDLTTVKEMEKEAKKFKVEMGNPQEGWVSGLSNHLGRVLTGLKRLVDASARVAEEAAKAKGAPARSTSAP